MNKWIFQLNNVRCSNYIDQILHARKIQNRETILNPELKVNIRELSNVSKVIDFIYNNRNLKYEILADVDVDGAFSGKIILDVLKFLGIKTTLRLGMSRNRNDLTYSKYADVFIMLDKGTNARQFSSEVLLQDKKLIIIDHHLIEKSAITEFLINPFLDYITEAKSLCSAGLCYLFGLELMKRFNRYDETLEKHICQLSAIATIADMVDMKTETNRAIVSKGLKYLNNTDSAIFEPVMRFFNENNIAINSVNISFYFIPLINSASRMNNTQAIHLLLNESTSEQGFAFLMNINDQRKRQQSLIEEKLFKEINLDNRYIYYILKENYPGLISAIATKLNTLTNKPVFLGSMFKENGQNFYKFSARGENIYKIISDLHKKIGFKVFGGHEFACGFVVEETKLKILEKMIHESLKHIEPKSKEFFVDCVLDNIPKDYIEKINILEPFGNGFPVPTIYTKLPKEKQIESINNKHTKIIIDEHSDVVFWNNKDEKIKDAKEVLLQHYQRYNNKQTFTVLDYR
ncbi:MAG: DHH family phosphoesterase [Endomicrobia bacterium]|nr:DHH family phosphoesterase [Endomicrobiia bacterium]